MYLNLYVQVSSLMFPLFSAKTELWLKPEDVLDVNNDLAVLGNINHLFSGLLIYTQINSCLGMFWVNQCLKV